MVEEKLTHPREVDEENREAQKAAPWEYSPEKDKLAEEVWMRNKLKGVADDAEANCSENFLSRPTLSVQTVLAFVISFVLLTNTLEVMEDHRGRFRV